MGERIPVIDIQNNTNKFNGVQGWRVKIPNGTVNIVYKTNTYKYLQAMNTTAFHLTGA